MDSIYTSYKPLKLTGAQLLKREPSFNGMPPFSKCAERSLLPFIGDALSWLIGMAITRNERDIKKGVKQLVEAQTQHQENLGSCHLFIKGTMYAMQVKRQHINAVIEVVERTHNNIATLFNITSSIYTPINYQQIFLHIHSILSNLSFSVWHETDSHACDELHRYSHH